MKLIYKDIKVRMRDGACIITKRVPAWEVPVLQAVWGDEAVEVGEAVVEQPNPPTSDAEFARLSRVYAFERDEGGNKGIPFVEAVYGQHGAGRAALKAAMLASIADQGAPVTPRPEPPKVNPELLEAIKTDVLPSRASEDVSADLIG